jgi:hypothetical protein
LLSILDYQDDEDKLSPRQADAIFILAMHLMQRTKRIFDDPFEVEAVEKDVPDYPKYLFAEAGEPEDEDEDDGISIGDIIGMVGQTAVACGAV